MNKAPGTCVRLNVHFSVNANINANTNANDNDNALMAQYTDRVDLKHGLLNKRVCTVKFPVVESYFFCNTTHTNQAVNQNGPGGLVIHIL